MKVTLHAPERKKKY